MKHASLDTMLKLVAIKFHGKFDKGGVPYVMHCIEVMNGVKHLGYKAMMIGLGHDLIEDTDITVLDLRFLNFHPDVVSGIESMTHKEGDSYDDYIKQIISSTVAHYTVPVKMADLRHNMDITRLKDTRPKDYDRLVKYAKAYKRLEVLV